ncbi:hypothetical protein BGZ72_004231 [Mortierella alpina]|nr:hypothetical protein BGZ72_004231 [Mortierella alpina]
MPSRPQWLSLVLPVIVCLVAYAFTLFMGPSQHGHPNTASSTRARVLDKTSLQSTRSSAPEMVASVPAKLTAIVHDATAKHTATVIFLHGFGDSGAGWAPVGEQLGLHLPHVKFIFPNAPAIPITVNEGMLTPAWYNILSMSTISREQDEQGLLRSQQQVMQIIHEEVEKNRIPANRIVIGGFSQGCVLGLLTALTSELKFAGVVSLSGYMPLHTKIMNIVTEANRKTPIFFGHGSADQVVKYEYGQQTVEFLQKHGYNVKLHTYPRMGHSVCPEELGDLLGFLKETVPEAVPLMAKV